MEPRQIAITVGLGIALHVVGAIIGITNIFYLEDGPKGWMQRAISASEEDFLDGLRKFLHCCFWPGWLIYKSIKDFLIPVSKMLGHGTKRVGQITIRKISGRNYLPDEVVPIGALSVAECPTCGRR